MKQYALVLAITGVSFGSQVDDHGLELFHLPTSILQANYVARAKIESKVDTSGRVEGASYGFQLTTINVKPERVYVDERPKAGVLRVVAGTGGFQKRIHLDSTYLLMLFCDTARCRIVDWKYTKGSEILLEKATFQLGPLLDKKCPNNPYSFVRNEIPAEYLSLVPISQIAFVENIAFVRKHYYWAKVWYPEPNSSGFYALRKNGKGIEQGLSNPPLYYIAEEVVKLFDDRITEFERTMELKPGALLEKSWKPD